MSAVSEIAVPLPLPGKPRTADAAPVVREHAPLRGLEHAPADVRDAVGVRVVELPAVILDALGERLPDRRLRRLVAAVLVDSIQQVLTEVVIGQVASSATMHGR
mgnify:CR=1 FL=1